MGYKQRTALTETVELSQGYSALIHVLRKRDEDACQAILLGDAKTRAKIVSESDEDGDSTGSRTEQDLEMDNAAYTTEVIFRGTTSWTLDDDNGKVMDVTREAIEDVLTGPDAKLLVKGINGLGKSGEPAKKKK